MLPINKLTEPQGLRHYKSSSEQLTYEDLSRYRTYINKSGESAFFELRSQLLKEQKYVCAFCGQKLLLLKMKMELLK